MIDLNYPIKPLSSIKVELFDEFWSQRMKTIHKVTIPHALEKCEKTRRIDNFRIAAGTINKKNLSKFPFDDSDVFKLIEGIAYDLTLNKVPELEEKVDELIELIGSAQEKDGYIYTHRTANLSKPHPWIGKNRWELTSIYSHELYNVGHLYEAGVAYYNATGKRKLLDIALKNAELVYKEFGPGKIEDPPGHQEIELALFRLFHITQDERFLSLAEFFLNARGNKNRKNYDFYLHKTEEQFPWKGEHRLEYNQTHAPIIDQETATGHAVRAMYMYSAMTDLAVSSKDNRYLKTLEKIWDNIMSTKIYITGGIGNELTGEAFGEEYLLPNATAYNETCAAIGNILWNFRLFLLKAESKYIDVLERTLYNGFLSGLGLDGRHFFYTNPLQTTGNLHRKKWYTCACCPPNIIRLIPTIPMFIYAWKADTVYVNLFIASKGVIEYGQNRIIFTQETRYPWEDNVNIKLGLSKPTKLNLAIRIPGWLKNHPLPSDLYRYVAKNVENMSIKINGISFDLLEKNGYAIISRLWEDDDEVELEFPMKIRRIVSNQKVVENIGKVALERGPIVFCFESVDNDFYDLQKIGISDEAEMHYEFYKDLLNGIGTIKVETDALKDQQKLMAIPYYAWAHRGKSKMTVWMNRG